MPLLVFAILASHVDPEDPMVLEKVGERKTMRGAQTFAAKVLGRPIHGWKRVGNTYGDPILETWSGPKDRIIRIERGWW